MKIQRQLFHFAPIFLINLELLEFLLALPAEIRMSGGSPKDLLRTAMAGDLPTEILERKDKMGFPVPFVAWNKAGLPTNIRQYLNNLSDRNIPGVTINAQYQQSSQSHIDARELWGGLLLESWLSSLD